MTEDYVLSAVTRRVASAKVAGELASRPLRLDGLTIGEIDGLLPPLAAALGDGRVRVLGPLNNESAGLINAERATRYRNEVDAGSHRDGFVLLVPQGQVVESSLDEPAFMVVTRGALFRRALGEEKLRRGLSATDIEGLREAARFRHAESIFAFLSHWDVVDQVVAQAAPHDYLGLLEDSMLAGDADTVRARLRDNFRATEILLQTGVSPGRILDVLAKAVGLDVSRGGQDVLDLVAWWHGGRRGPKPTAIDFATWPLAEVGGPEIIWQANLSLPPHRGWQDRDGRVEVDPTQAKATVQWAADGVSADTAFELELVEETSQRALIRIGRTRSTRRQIVWARLFRGEEVLDELRELNPAGEEDGYLFRIRLNAYVGKRWHSEYVSDPFTAVVRGSASEETVAAPAPTAYHALYRLHSEQRLAEPTLGTLEDPPPAGDRVLIQADGRTRESSLDLTETMALVEHELFAQPRAVGPWILGPSDEGPMRIARRGETALEDDAGPFLDAREAALRELAVFGSVEAADVLRPSVRAAVLAYLREFDTLVGGLASYVESIGGAAANEDRLRAARYLALDAVIVPFSTTDDDRHHRVLLVAPTSPPVLAWLLGLQETLHGWSRGAYDPALKPPYRRVVDQFAAGPRTMVWPTPGDSGDPEWWGFAGNLTAIWQAFLPIGSDPLVRSLNWEGALIDVLGLPPRAIGAGSLDARRIGGRIKKYAVLHPYVNQLRIAAVMSGDGQPLLDALKVVDEAPNTPAGAQSVRDVRYELTMVGPRSGTLGRAVDEMTLNPGEHRWRRYTSAIMDNPETLLAPGFAFAKRQIAATGGELWSGINRELSSFDAEGLHITIIGPMLTASVGHAPAQSPVAADSLGLSARPVTTELPALGDSPYVGNWLLRVPAPVTDGTSRVALSLRTLVTTCNLAFGSADPTKQVGLQVALAGPMAENLRLAHQVSDWVIIADPLFSIEQLDRRRTVREAILLDFTPEFDPYPGGRVVVTTSSLRELDPLTGPIDKALSATGPFTAVLASISARLLLNLSNPTKQVVNGLAGLALTREFIRTLRPGALVLPVDGHEDMFVTRRRGGNAKLADLLAVSVQNDRVHFDVFESKWVGRQNLDKKVQEAVSQAQTTQEVLRSEYVLYRGVDRQLRLGGLLQAILFQLERAARHGVPVGFDGPAIAQQFRDPVFGNAEVASHAVIWSPDASLGAQVLSTKMARVSGHSTRKELLATPRRCRRGSWARERRRKTPRPSQQPSASFRKRRSNKTSPIKGARN